MKTFLSSLIVVGFTHFAAAQTPPQACEDDSDCASGTCKDGTCIATELPAPEPPAAPAPPEPSATAAGAAVTPPPASPPPPASAPVAANDPTKKKNGERCASDSECASGTCEYTNLKEWVYWDQNGKFQSCGVTEETITDAYIAKNCPSAVVSCGSVVVGTPCSDNRCHTTVRKCEPPKDDPFRLGDSLPNMLPGWIDKKYDSIFGCF